MGAPIDRQRVIPQSHAEALAALKERQYQCALQVCVRVFVVRLGLGLGLGLGFGGWGWGGRFA